MSGRGALLILEGCDRAGKSTQAKMLVQQLNNRGIRAEARSFPNRSTLIGQVINEHLSKNTELPAEAVHLLFSANRWECKQDILTSLKQGITLVVDRYAASGAAYTAAITKKSLEWCKQPDAGLPSPDMVALLTVTNRLQQERKGWGVERFEKDELQKRVASNYELLVDDTWTVIDGSRSVEDIHDELLEKSLKVINRVKDCPVGLLYQS